MLPPKNLSRRMNNFSATLFLGWHLFYFQLYVHKILIIYNGRPSGNLFSSTSAALLWPASPVTFWCFVLTLVREKTPLILDQTSLLLMECLTRFPSVLRFSESFGPSSTGTSGKADAGGGNGKDST